MLCGYVVFVAHPPRERLGSVWDPRAFGCRVLPRPALVAFKITLFPFITNAGQVFGGLAGVCLYVLGEKEEVGRKAGEPLLPLSEKNCSEDVECWWWWCGFDGWQSRHDPVGVLGFSLPNVRQTG